VHLEAAELTARAKRTRIVVTDVDGVLTDAGVYYSPRGEELKRFSMRDGMGVERLRDAGIETGLLTRETSPIVQARGEKLKVRYVWMGVRDKRMRMRELERETGYRLPEVTFIGDDVNDVELMHQIVEAGGLTAAPGDAFTTALDAATYVTKAYGGHGAFRELAEWLIALRAGAPL
jgi:3-deoxy-D-manno-octulosonate 8-phosphate phosphatase (KDO 8-P phosphatase)